jgi:pescadillo protein
LPPHLSPFVEEKEGEYVPPERLGLLNDLAKYVEDEKQDAGSESESDEASGDESMEDDDDDDDDDDDEEKGGETSNEDKERSDSDEVSDTESKEPPKKKANVSEAPTLSKRQMKKQEKILKSSMAAEKKVTAVTAGQLERVDANRVREQSEREEKRLAEMMIPKKKQRLYRKIMHLKKKTAQEARILSEKRQEYERKQKTTKSRKLAKKP